MADQIRTTQANDLSEIASAFDSATSGGMSPTFLTVIFSSCVLGMALVFAIYVIVSRASDEREKDFSTVVRTAVLAIITIVLLLGYIALSTI